MARFANPSVRRAWRALLALCGVAGTVAILLLPAASADASTPFPFLGSFTGPTLDSGWSMPSSETLGGSAASAYTNNATLTGTNSTPGWLQLTPATGNEDGWVYNTNPFLSSAGVLVNFDYADYGGTGADGLTFFLFGSASNTTGASQSLTTGPDGGSLGYAACSTNNQYGLTNGYVGIGLDEYGNYGLSGFCGTTTGVGTTGINGTGRYPNYMIVRGPGNNATGYPYETGAPVADPGNASEKLVGSSISDTRHVTVLITPAGKLSVYITFPDGNTQTVTTGYQLPSDPPQYLQLGFVASTGGSTDYHDIRASSVTEPVDMATRVTTSSANAARGATITDSFTVTNTEATNESKATTIAATSAAALSNVSWTCSGADCNLASGTGLPSDTDDIVAGQSVVYTVTGTDNSTSDRTVPITLTATPTGAEGQSVPGDNVATATTVLPPVNQTAPTFTLVDGGTNYTGVATVTQGTYTGNGITITEQWQRCLPGGGTCTSISGATGTTYNTTSADRGDTIRVAETATNSAGAVTVDSSVFSPLPITTLSTGTAADTSQTSASFTLGTSNYTSGQVSYECNLDGAGYSNCSSTPSYTGLSNGSHTLLARSVFAGLSDPNPQSFTWTVDTVAPAAPVVTTPANGSYTNNNEPPITGTAEANSTVTVYIDSSDVGTAVTNGSGAWTYTPTTVLVDGAHSVYATATDGAGNVSAASSTNTFTVDTVAPAAPVVTTPANGSYTNNNEPPITGTAEANSTVTVYIDGTAVGTTTANGSGAWTYTPSTSLSDGSHTVKSTATDGAGNVSAPSGTNTFTVDTVAPAAPTVTAPANASLTSNTMPPVTGTAEANSTVTVYIDGTAVGTTTANGSGAWSYTPTAALSQGSHTVRASATDGAGNVSPFSGTNTFTVDSVAPVAPTVTTPANGSATNNTQPPVTGTAEANSTVTVYLDGTAAGTTTANGSGAWTYTPTTPLSQASHTVKATATDAAGNVSVASATNTFTVDTTAPAAPTVATPSTGTDTNNNKPPITGTAEANSTVTVYIDGTAVGTTTANGSGAWTYTPTTSLSDASHTVYSRATDAAGNVSAASGTNTFTVDTSAPAAPAVSSPANGADTNNNEPPITGTAEANSTVTVFVDGTAVGTTTADGSGAWTYTPLTALSDGSHTVKSTATDGAGNVSAASGTNTFTVDTTAPAAPTVATPTTGTDTSNNRPPITGTAEANSTVTVYIDGTAVGTTTANGSGAWTYTPTTSLSDGSHAVKSTSTDGAGNVSAFSGTNTFTVDSTAPAAPAVSTPAAGSSTNNTEPPITGTAEANSTVTVYIDGTAVGTTTANSSGAWTYTPTTPLGNGSHAVASTATDAAGNVSPISPSHTFTVDTVAPAAPTVATPSTGTDTNNNEPPITGTAEANSTVTVYIDGTSVGTTTANGSGAWTYTPTTALSDGPHSVNSTSTDAAGNVSVASGTNTFTVDTVAPVAPVVSVPANGSYTNNNKPTMSGTAEANSTVTVYVDGTAVTTTTASGGGAWSYSPSSPLADGSHTVRATSTDAAHNTSVSSNTNTFSIITHAPSPPAVSTPTTGADTNNNEPPITGTATPGTTVTVYVDGSPVGTTTTNSSGNWTYTPTTPLSDGVHTVTSTATDAAGNVSPSSGPNTFTVDTVAPAAPVVTGPTPGTTTSNNKPTITGTAEPGSTVTVIVDGQPVGTTTTDGNGNFTYTGPTPLSDGPHTVTVTATDAAGNVSASSGAGSGSGSGAAGTNTATGGTGTGSGGSSTTGGDTFTVNTATPPPPVVVTAPPTISKTSNFTFTNTPGTTLECSIDGGAYTTCPTDFDPTSLSDGPHTLSVKQINTAGTQSPIETITWILDTTPPGPPTVTGGPLGATPINTGTFTFSPAKPGGTFQCRIDNGPWTTCKSGVTYTGLPLGAHTFEVREVDQGGLVGQPSIQKFTVGSKDPLPPTKSYVDAAARVQVGHQLPVGCHLDHGALQSCTVYAFALEHHKLTFLGKGSVTLPSPQGVRAPVTISFNQAAVNVLHRTYAGVPTFLVAHAYAFGLAKMLPAQGFTRVITPEKLIIPGNGLFAFNSAVVEPAGRRYVSFLASSLYEVKSITCIGYTDSVGSASYNYTLGMKRARAVCQLLTSESSMHGVSYTLASYGKNRPRVSNSTSQGRALNRFAQVNVTYR